MVSQMTSLNLSDLDHVYGDRRRRHNPQLSISDDNHHVTEAIGDMYGDSESIKSEGRPMSFVSSLHEEPMERRANNGEPTTHESSLARLISNERNTTSTLSHGPSAQSRKREPSLGSSNPSTSPPMLSRSGSSDNVNATANHHFPLNDIDYESSPASLAQELSNLQAIRRMSMNVDTADPDLPSFASGFGVPTVAPSHSADEDDASRLFWVPARLHPELAPKEFKTFVEDRVDRIKRRSGEDAGGSVDGPLRRGSSRSLDRRTSMLSKTVEAPSDLRDGAEVLERKRSKPLHRRETSAETSLHELEHLVNDPSNLIRKMSIDASRSSFESTQQSPDEGDMPILPAGGPTLKRSTRTQYRKGGSIRRDRGTLSRRGPGRRGDEEAGQAVPPVPTLTEPSLQPLSRVSTEPTPSPYDSHENFSRPSRRGRGPPPMHPSASLEDVRHQDQSQPYDEDDRPQARAFHSRIARNGRTTAPLPGYAPRPGSVPQIVETPPVVDPRLSLPIIQQSRRIPERTSSHELPRTASLSHQTNSRSSLSRPARPAPNQTLNDMANNPSLMPGTSTSTDALSFIPTFEEKEKDRKPERKAKDRSDAGDPTPRKGSWSWLTGSESKDKDKRKEEKEEKESRETKKTKSKFSRLGDKSHDSTRLDVLQTTSDGSKGRESLVLDRENLKLEEERKKESSRKSANSDSKKEKESGIFSSLFGGKKKAERDTPGRKIHVIRGLSPEPPRKPLAPDIDYNWGRFSILEERAIYRMAHIKLANPRRALYSQVLLSNFMYSYLAKVQQSHPQMQVPQSPAQQKAQKAKDAEQQSKESDEFSQWQRYQEQQERLNGPSDGTNSQSDASSTSPPSNSAPQSSYIDDYDAEHQQYEDSLSNAASYSRRQANGGYSSNGSPHHQPYQQQQQQHPHQHHHQHQQQQQQQQQQHWEDTDPYTQQGLFDDSRSPNDDDMW
ncbi:MAG: hypothetical protein M1828_001789 [Chrysothrix sp. TS-e1954]|nr:MAG: hypothetical protein M1828_001789 [Chrysothrix sp. TS-e1954]